MRPTAKLFLLCGIALGAVVVLVGCGRPPITDRPPETFTTFTLSRTGGFDGVPHTIEVRPDGSYTVRTPRRPDRTGTLKRDELAEVRTLATSKELAAEGGRRAGSPGSGRTCADTFQYELVMGSLTVSGDQCDGPDLGQPVLYKIIQVLGPRLS